MKASNRREFLMLAHDFDFDKHRTAGMYVSEKLDGMRCIWIPWTKGLSTESVAFSNAKKPMVCSGLWSRYGHPIHCPAGFTAGWPEIVLDGELWIGRQTMQQLMSAVKKHEPVAEEWAPVRFYVFDQPSISGLFRPGVVKNANYEFKFSGAVYARADQSGDSYSSFDYVYRRLAMHVFGASGSHRAANSPILLEQTLTDFNTDTATKYITSRLAEVSAGGGEGLMIRYAGGKWEPIRSKELLKLKKLQIGEGVICGFKAGLGKHQGRIGSVRVAYQGLEFDLAGFTDNERALQPAWAGWADVNAGAVMPADACGLAFSVGDKIRFQYRDLTDGGTPKEARYFS